jgi:hypothetical protein
MMRASASVSSSRPLIRADILAARSEAEGLLDEVVKGASK